jgi:hypothetical protein
VGPAGPFRHLLSCSAAILAAFRQKFHLSLCADFPGHLSALVVGDLEKPSDYNGIVFISYDKRGAWKLELAREFTALHIPFDPLKAF